MGMGRQFEKRKVGGERRQFKNFTIMPASER
jgi:hypothetical protein